MLMMHTSPTWLLPVLLALAGIGFGMLCAAAGYAATRWGKGYEGPRDARDGRDGL